MKTGTTIHKTIQDPYCLIPKKLSLDRTLSHRAKAIYLLLSATVDTGSVCSENVGGTLSWADVKKGIAELAEAGYVTADGANELTLL